MRLRARARHVSASGARPFVLGIAGDLSSRGGRTVLSPLGVALRRDPSVDPAADPIPRLDAGGALALDNGLVLGLEGDLAHWPEAWPPLPLPLSASNAPIPFALGYSGATDLSDPARLRLRRDGSAFDGRLRLADFTAWIDEDGRLSPLPPIDGHASIPRMELGGATLHGVEVSVDDPALDTEQQRDD
jgi:hypothetical protein